MSENTDPQARATSNPQDLRQDPRTQLETLNNSIDELHRSLSEQLRALQKSIDTYFLWMMGTLVTIAGVLIAVIKL